MKNERQRIKDFNILSAYLDNMLKEKEQKKLKARLEKEPALRKELENLKRTKFLLGRLEHVSAPRNFTLTPDMVTVRRRKNKPLFTTLRLATSFAAILLVALFGVQAVLQDTLLPISMQSEAPMMEEAARIADESTPEPLIFWGDSNTGGAVAEGYGGGGPESMAEESFVLEEPAQEEEMAPEEQPEVLPEEEMAPPESLESESPPSSKDLEENSPILGINPDQSGEILELSRPDSDDEGMEINWGSAIQWAQIGLAAIAIAGGLTLWLLSRRG